MMIASKIAECAGLLALQGDTPLHIAARWARLPVMQALWDAGAVVDAVNCKVWDCLSCEP